jgi:cytochrome c oxidase subunit 3
MSTFARKPIETEQASPEVLTTAGLTALQMIHQYHPHHLTAISPWPILTANAVLSMLTGAVLWFNGIVHGNTLLSLGFISTVTAFILWFRDVTTEGTHLGLHTRIVQSSLSLGISLFIVTEAFFFLSIFWAYFHSSLSPTVELGAQWPPVGIISINPITVPLLNTVLLVSSGATVTYAHHAIFRGGRGAAVLGLILTIVLAIAFTALQAFEYNVAGFSIPDGAFGSCFFFGTGFHGLHVLIGTLFIAVGAARMVLYHLTRSHHIGLEASILYWHFVDVVWLFLYLAVYWWGS